MQKHGKFLIQINKLNATGGRTTEKLFLQTKFYLFFSKLCKKKKVGVDLLNDQIWVNLFNKYKMLKIK